MNSKPMLLECLDCGETYLADNLCEGYRCPKCDGFIVGRGFIKDLEENMAGMEERIKVTRDKITKAKENGLIRKYTKLSKANHIPRDGHIAALPFDTCMHGVDLASGKNSTVFTIHVDIDELTNINKVVRRFDKFLKTKCVDVIV